MRGTRWALLTVMVATGLSIVAATPAAADPGDERDRVQREIAAAQAALENASERVEAAAVALGEANSRLPDVRRQLADARGVLAAARATANTAAAAARTARADLSEANLALVAAVAKVDETRSDVSSYARNAYMGRDVAGLNALLAVENPADFVAGLSYLDHVAAGQRVALDAHTQARSEAKNSQNAQALRARIADEAKRAADRAVNAAVVAETVAVAAEHDVARLVAQREQAYAVAEQERASTEARIAELQAESDRITADVRNRANAGGSSVVPVGIKLLMPVNGWKSSDFGNRFDPVYKRWQLHAGVDLAAAGGSLIRAVAPGEVMRAGWNGGYGNYTCVYHGTYQGKGFATCYAHQSAVLVKAGQQVRQGDVIGRVGTTGASTGNHLHFEVRLDGTPVNPVPWLPACLC